MKKGKLMPHKIDNTAPRLIQIDAHGDNVKATLFKNGKSAGWGQGETALIAIGDLVQSHPEDFELQIVVSPQAQEILDRKVVSAFDKFVNARQRKGT